jgi:flagellar hook protein FlgE
MEALAAARGLRHYARPASMDLPGDLRDMEPTLGLPWEEDEHEPETAEPEMDLKPAAREVFLVCEQAGSKSTGEPIFGPAFGSVDDDLALSEDGYLINGAGRFLLGLPLDEAGEPAASEPKIVRLDASAIETEATARITYRANLPAFPMTANAEFDVDGSELLDKTLFARDPSVQASGIVLGDDRLKFLDRTLAGGSLKLTTPDGGKIQLVLRWAKMTSQRSAGKDCWNLFYRVRRDARAGEVAWKNTGQNFVFSPDGRLDKASLVVPVIDMMIDGTRMGNVSLIFGTGGITQFADRSGLVKVLKSEADGCVGGAFTGLSMSGRGRLFAHYANGTMRPLADIQFTGTESWFRNEEDDWDEDEWDERYERRVA